MGILIRLLTLTPLYSYLSNTSNNNNNNINMSKQSDLHALLDNVSSQQALLAQFLVTLAPNSALESSSRLPPNPPNPLLVLRDSATLLKAHTTKLSLLLINKPFTATAVQKVLRDVSGTCLPAMMSAVEICQPTVWGSFLRQQIIARVRTVMREMDVCYNEVKLITTQQIDEAAKAKAKPKSGDVQDKGRDSLVSTGLVWDACDKLVELESVGIGGLAVKRAEEWRDMIKDAIEELKEWEEGDGEDDDDDEDEAANSDHEAEDDKDSVDDMFSAANSLPKNRPDLSQRLATANDKLKKIGMLYAALTKRRLKTFTPAVAASQKNLVTLDNLLDTLKELPDTVDDLASSFYDLNTEQVDDGIQNCLEHATRAVELVKLDWDSNEDEFTAWANKWLEIVK